MINGNLKFSRNHFMHGQLLSTFNLYKCCGKADIKKKKRFCEQIMFVQLFVYYLKLFVKHQGWSF